MYITFIDEREEKAYSEIKLIYAKEKDTNIFNVYFNTLIKKKMIQLIPNRKTVLDDLTINEANKLLKEKYTFRVLENAKIPITLNDFSLTVKHSLEPEFEELIKWQKERNDAIKAYLDFFCNTINQYRIDGFNCIYSNNKMVNLVLMMYWCGPIYRIDDYKLLKKNMVVNKKAFVHRIKEFFVNYEDCKPSLVNSNSNNINHTISSLSLSQRIWKSFGNTIDNMTMASRGESISSGFNSYMSESTVNNDEKDMDST